MCWTSRPRAPLNAQYNEANRLSSITLNPGTDQAQTCRLSYDPNGKTTSTADGEGNASQYTTRENDGTGLYYYRARHYDPVLKRFCWRSPLLSRYSGSASSSSANTARPCAHC